jgi:phosphate/sulfate permease
MQGSDVVGSQKIILSSFMLPLTGLIHSVLLYFILRNFSKLDKKTILKALMGVLVLLPVYALLFVKSYDSFKHSFDRLKILFLTLCKNNFYEELNKEKK